YQFAHIFLRETNLIRSVLQTIALVFYFYGIAISNVWARYDKVLYLNYKCASTVGKCFETQLQSTFCLAKPMAAFTVYLLDVANKFINLAQSLFGYNSKVLTAQLFNLITIDKRL
ncbi:hypothetical protein ACJX0J_012086, partial [Zea mays]